VIVRMLYLMFVHGAAGTLVCPMSGYLVQGMLRYNTTTGTGTITAPAGLRHPRGELH
jgi:hypothetical protein